MSEQNIEQEIVENNNIIDEPKEQIIEIVENIKKKGKSEKQLAHLERMRLKKAEINKQKKEQQEDDLKFKAYRERMYSEIEAEVQAKYQKKTEIIYKNKEVPVEKIVEKIVYKSPPKKFIFDRKLF